MKTLYLVRHAKSCWDYPSLSDLQRPLSKRGLRDAPVMGQRLADAGVTVDRLISSPANRAMSTAEFLATAIGYQPDKIQQNRQLYFEGSESMLELIRHTGAEIRSLMLVGHNPDMTALFNRLCADQTDNMPTCAIASIRFRQAWSEVGDGSGMLMDYDFPKNKRRS